MNKLNGKARVVALMLSAVLLMAITAAATVAYLSDRDSVTNVFTVGQVNISLKETDPDGQIGLGADTDGDGQPDEVKGGLLDTNHDGVPDAIDTNGDGKVVDANGDGKPDDADGDGQPDDYLIVVPNADLDGDGKIDPPFVDVDNNGTYDPTVDYPIVDENGDGTYDYIDKDRDGVKDEGEALPGSAGNEYHLIPGYSYLKDPTITVAANSEPTYLRMMLTVHNASAVQAILDKYQLGDYSVLLGGWDNNVWQYHGFTEDTAANTITFEFRYPEVVAGGAQDTLMPALFTKVIAPSQLTNEDLLALYGDIAHSEGDFKMVVVGHAIQAATFADANAAWAAFDLQNTNA